MSPYLLIALGAAPIAYGAWWAWKNDRALLQAALVVVTALASLAAICVGVSVLMAGGWS